MTDTPSEPIEAPLAGPDDLGYMTAAELDQVALYAFDGVEGVRPPPDDFDLRPTAPHGRNEEFETDASLLYGD